MSTGYFSSLVDGGGLWTHFSDPMHTLRSSGCTISGIYFDDLSWSPRTKIPEFTLSHIQIHGFRPVCTPSQKKSCFSSLFGSNPLDYITCFRFDENAVICYTTHYVMHGIYPINLTAQSQTLSREAENTVTVIVHNDPQVCPIPAIG